MPRIPLPNGLEGSEDLPHTRRDLHNCFNTGNNTLMPRPGIELIASIDGVARGLFQWNDTLYQVQSNNLVKIDDVDTGASTVIGSISGVENVKVDFGFNEAVIVVKGGEIYSLTNESTQIDITSVTAGGNGEARFNHAGQSPVPGDTVTISGFTTNTSYNAVNAIVTGSSPTTFDVDAIPFVSDDTGQYTNVLNKISDNSNFVPCIDVAHMNGRFIFIPEDGEPAFFSDVGNAGSVQPLSFFDAEELPDKNNAVFNWRNTLYIGGTDSFELFVDTGATPNPYQRISRSRILNGYIGGLIEYSDTYLFVGREKDQDQGIYAIGQGNAVKISNEPIDLILSTYTEAELANAVSGRFKWRGYDVATFSLPNHAFGFIGGNWFNLTTLINNIIKPWTIGFIVQYNNTYYTAFSTKFGKLSKINTDLGNPIPRIIDTVADDAEGEFFAIQKMELGISQGYNTENKSVALQMSRDNVTYGQHLYKNLGKIGEYSNRVRWNPPGGLGNYESFAGIRIYCAEDVSFAIEFIAVTVR